MGHDVTSSGLSAIGTGEQGAGTRIGLDVVRQQDCDVEDLGKIAQSAKMLTELLLSLRKLTTSNIVGSEEIENAVNNQETIIARSELLSELPKFLLLIFAVCGPDDEKIIICLLWIDCEGSVCPICCCGQRTVEACCDLGNPLRTKRALGIDDGHFS